MNNRMDFNERRTSRSEKNLLFLNFPFLEKTENQTTNAEIVRQREKFKQLFTHILTISSSLYRMKEHVYFY